MQAGSRRNSRLAIRAAVNRAITPAMICLFPIGGVSRYHDRLWHE